MWAVAAALFFLQATDFNAEGMKALEEGEVRSRCPILHQSHRRRSKDYFAHFNLGLAYGLLNRDDEGIAEYRKTLELQPRLYEAELNAAILLMRQKEPAEALPLLEDAVSQKPNELRPLAFLAEAQLQTGAADKAGETYRAAFSLTPSRPIPSSDSPMLSRVKATSPMLRRTSSGPPSSNPSIATACSSSPACTNRIARPLRLPPSTASFPIIPPPSSVSAS